MSYIAGRGRALARHGQPARGAGLDRGLPAEGDGRGPLATLTPAGRSALANAAVGHAVLIKQFLLDDIPPDDQVRIGDIMDRLAAHMHVYRRGEPCLRCGPVASEPTT